MSFEVDIHAVGEETTSGDAIAFRFGDLSHPSRQYVVVIDGGFQSSGEKLVQKIKDEYNTKYVDLIISTHPDKDHINGLCVLLENLTVGELWMHTPWNISENVQKIAEERGLNSLFFDKKIKDSLQAAYDLEKLALQKGIKIVEPFTGTSAFNNTIHILGPDINYYYELVSQFDEGVSGLSLSDAVQNVKSSIVELWHKDELVDPAEDAVNARNNSSVITLVQMEKNFLFLGDSGVPAIMKAADYADANNFDLAARVDFIQVPHHGSKRNLGPSILNRIIGPILPLGQLTGKVAFISAADNNPKHPSIRVKNALIRRGMTVNETCGIDRYFRSLDLPMRPGWIPTEPVSFCPVYDED